MRLLRHMRIESYNLLIGFLSAIVGAVLGYFIPYVINGIWPDIKYADFIGRFIATGIAILIFYFML